jgi:hypothetical protein
MPAFLRVPAAAQAVSGAAGAVKFLAPSSSGPGRRPLKAVAPVQIRSGLLMYQQVEGLIVERGGWALIS